MTPRRELNVVIEECFKSTLLFLIAAISLRVDIRIHPGVLSVNLRQRLFL
jgi:hypothetical protein